jgi:hypothetical protein
MTYLKSLSLSLFILLFSACVYNKKTEVKKPYAINEERKKLAVRSEHFGILNEDDINIYAWEMDSGAPLQTAGYGMFWTCYHKSKIKRLYCRSFGPDLSDKNITNSELEFDIQADGVVIKMGQRHAFEYNLCKKMIKEWKDLLKNEEHFCVGVEQERSHPETKEYRWTYDKFKTKKGCVSYFAGHCEKKYWAQCGYPNISYHDEKNPCRNN